MTKEKLLNEQKTYFDKVEKWFLSELAKWSKKHSIHISYYFVLKMWRIGSEVVYSPYALYEDEMLKIEFKDALKELETLFDDLSELGIDKWQGLEYTDQHKFIQ